jgi:FolB domain-containing protein
MDKVFIKDLSVRGIIGINDWEREKPQEILINIEMVADLYQAGQTDDVVTASTTAFAKSQRHANYPASPLKPWQPTWRAQPGRD